MYSFFSNLKSTVSNHGREIAAGTMAMLINTANGQTLNSGNCTCPTPTATPTPTPILDTKDILVISTGAVLCLTTILSTAAAFFYYRKSRIQEQEKRIPSQKSSINDDNLRKRLESGKNETVPLLDSQKTLT